MLTRTFEQASAKQSLKISQLKGKSFFTIAGYVHINISYNSRGQVIIADINIDAGSKFAEELNARYTAKYAS